MSNDVHRLWRTMPFAQDTSLGREAGELLLRVAYETEQMLARASQDEGLTAREARVLRYVQEAQPQHELAKRLGVDPARMTTLMKTLEARGFVQREGWVDRRVRMVSITAEGLAAIDRIGRRIASTSRFVQELTPAERDQLLHLLSRLAQPPTDMPNEG